MQPVKTNALKVHRKISLILNYGKINESDKLFKKFQKSCLHVDKDNYTEARNEVQKLIRANKKLTLKVD